MNYTEEKKMIMDCLAQFNDKNENVAETLFNVYPSEMDALVRLLKKCRIANVSVSLLEEAATLVGNPGTNISGSCDVACMEWQEKYERWRLKQLSKALEE